MMQRTGWISGAAVLLLAAAGCGNAGKEHGPSQPGADSAPPLRVAVIRAQVSEWPTFFEAPGTVRARSSASIASRVMAYVREVRVQVGDRVRAGQPLVLLDARDLEVRRRQAEAGRTEAQSAAAESENAIAAAQANLQLAEVTFRRMKDLYDKKSLSEQEFDEASTKVKLARANLDMAESRRKQVHAKIAQAGEELQAAEIMRGYSVVTAPFAGVVTEKPVEPGNLATPGAPMLTIEQSGAYRLEVAIEESNLGKVRVGQTVKVHLDAFPGEMDGRVSEIVPAVDPAARSFTAKIDLPSPARLHSGQFGRARFPVGQRASLVIPSSAVQEKGQVQWVWTVEHGRARNRMVTLGDAQGDRVEVLSGLNPEETFVASPPPGIRDGARVEVRP